MFNYGLTPQMVITQPPPQAAASGVNSVPRTSQSAGAVVIDGTPLRVVVFALAAGAGLVALRLGGFRFNVGVSS